MNYFEKILLTFLWDGKLEMNISGLDLDAFEEAICEESKHRLEMVEGIIFADAEFVSDAEKVESIQKLFETDFCDED